MNFAKQKIKDIKKVCSVCSAQFEIWVNNSRLSQNREEDMRDHFLTHCPVCTRVDDK